MGLRTKFNLAALVAFLIGLGLAAVLLDRVFVANAQAQVLENARIMMSAADAVRHFTDKHLTPILPTDIAGRFVPETVPSFAAQTTFRDVQAQFPAYTYREPTLNPTNPVDRAGDWEADFINSFRNDRNRHELNAERDTPTGRSLSLARPIEVGSGECLVCHSTPAHAPAAMLASYGSANGFGWQLHEIVGAQIVSVPMALPMRAARQEFITCMAVLVGMFALVLAILNLLLHDTVIRPVVKLSRLANAVSLGETGIADYAPKGRDEIAVLAAAFTRMRRSLEAAMRMLEP